MPIVIWIHFYVPIIPIPAMQTYFFLSWGHGKPISVQLKSLMVWKTTRGWLRGQKWWEGLFERSDSSIQYVHNDSLWQLSLIQCKPPPPAPPPPTIHPSPHLSTTSSSAHPCLLILFFFCFSLWWRSSSVVFLNIVPEWLQEWQIYLQFLLSLHTCVHTDLFFQQQE